MSLSQEGNEVGVEFRDDGAGIDLARVRDKGVAMGLLEAGQTYGDAELANLIFTPGFSTAEKVTELAGRGIGMDVVKTNIQKLNGRVDVTSVVGQGSTFRIMLPLTLAILPVLMVRLGSQPFAVPLSMVLLSILMPGVSALPLAPRPLPRNSTSPPPESMLVPFSHTALAPAA